MGGFAPRRGFGPTRHRDPETGCHLWQRSTDKDGYGYFKANGKSVRAHIHYYQLARGPIPPGTELDHTCRNRRCCNPDHLEPVTHTENCRRGGLVRNGMTLEKAREIRALANGGTSHRTIAKQYGISASLVGHITTNRVWKDVTPFAATGGGRE